MENLEAVTAQIADTINSLGTVELSGIKLEEAKPELLDINSLNLDIHVAMQPAALAYYGQLRKDAMRRVADLKNKRERWGKAKYAEAKEACLRDMPKATVADIEARVIIDNMDEIKSLDELEANAQQIFDTLDVWYEAWKQKGYSIREHISMELSERANSNTSLGFDDGNDVIPPSGIPPSAPKDAANAVADVKKQSDVPNLNLPQHSEPPSISEVKGDSLDKLAKKFGRR